MQSLPLIKDQTKWGYNTPLAKQGPVREQMSGEAWEPLLKGPKRRHSDMNLYWVLVWCSPSTNDITQQNLATSSYHQSIKHHHHLNMHAALESAPKRLFSIMFMLPKAWLWYLTTLVDAGSLSSHILLVTPVCCVCPTPALQLYLQDFGEGIRPLLMRITISFMVPSWALTKIVCSRHIAQLLKGVKMNKRRQWFMPQFSQSWLWFGMTGTEAVG